MTIPSGNRPLWEKVRSDLARSGYVYSDTFAIVAATYVSRRWPGDPLWILIVGPPGTGKSHAMKLCRRTVDVISISSLTPASLITAWGGEENDRSILANSQNSLICIKDLGTILSLGWENMNAILSLLREAFDGYVSKAFAQITRSYETHFNICAAAVPAADIHFYLAQQLGERFLRFRPSPVMLPWPPVDMDDEAYNIVADWLNQIDDTEPYDVTEEGWIFDLAELASRVRSPVLRDKRSFELLEVPIPEQPHRLVKQLTKLFQGMLVVTGSYADSVLLTRQVMLGTMPPARRTILRVVLVAPGTGSQDVTDLTGLGARLVRSQLEDLKLLGVLKKEGGGTFPNKYKWSLAKETFEKVNALKLRV